MYKDLMQDSRVLENLISWKIKVPLKIKFFLWYLKKGVILTKDNLAKRNWKGDKKCCFCNNDESIQHLFFECQVAKFVWNVVFVTFGIVPPSSITNMLGTWLRGFNLRSRKLLLIGATAMGWAIWLSRNEVVFKQNKPNSYLQVLFRVTYWARFWSQLSEAEAMQLIKSNCQRLEGVIMELYNRRGWNFRSRIEQ